MLIALYFFAAFEGFDTLVPDEAGVARNRHNKYVFALMSVWEHFFAGRRLEYNEVITIIALLSLNSLTFSTILLMVEEEMAQGDLNFDAALRICVIHFLTDRVHLVPINQDIVDFFVDMINFYKLGRDGGEDGDGGDDRGGNGDGLEIGDDDRDVIHIIILD